MAALARDARRLQPGGSSAHHHDPAPRRCRHDHVRQRTLAPCRRIVDAERLVPLVDPPQAIGGPDTGPDPCLLPGRHLGDNVRIGDMCPGHADHVEPPLGDRVPGGRDVVDPRRVKDREPGRCPDLACIVEMRRGPHALHGDHVHQPVVAVDHAADHVQEIDMAGRHHAPGNLDPLIGSDPARVRLVGDESQSDDELLADPFADRCQNLAAEPQTVVQRAAVLVVAQVRQRRPEPVDQVAVALDFDPIEPSRRHALGGIRIACDDASDVPVLHLLWKRPMRRLAHARGRHDW